MSASASTGASLAASLSASLYRMLPTFMLTLSMHRLTSLSLIVSTLSIAPTHSLSLYRTRSPASARSRPVV